MELNIIYEELDQAFNNHPFDVEKKRVEIDVITDKLLEAELWGRTQLQLRSGLFTILETQIENKFSKWSSSDEDLMFDIEEAMLWDFLT